MSNKRTTKVTAEEQPTPEVAAFMETVKSLQDAGYVALPLTEALGEAYNPNDPSWNGIINSHFTAGCCDPHSPNSDMGRAVMSNGYECVQKDSNGVDHSFISWGADNSTPNHISLWSRMLPYTATSLKHLSELAMGCVVKPKYRFFTTAGGTVNAETIDYDAAGDLLRKRQRDLIKEKDLVKDNEELTKMLDNEIEQLRKDLDTWEKTNGELRKFMSDNNLPLFYLRSMQEMSRLGVTIPQLVLDKQGDQEASAKWTPRVVGIEHHPVVSYRLKKRDEQGRIRHVEMSNFWLSDRLIDDYKISIATLPALDEQRPSKDFEERIIDWKINHRSATPDERPARWVMPCIYPSDSNYYPYLAWWSIFEGDLYPYLATIISDRVTRKRNSNSMGRIVYIHTDYLNSINVEKDAKKKLAKAEELRDEIFRRTTRFLNDKSKNGSTMLSHIFTDSRGNMAKAIEIVDVPYTSKSQTEADKTELAEAASIVFFAMGVHPELIGSIPGSAASKGGTYMREMLLIDEVTSAAVLQQLVNRMFETIQDINKWDPNHLVWETPQKTLTTLDASKSGVVEE